jgi:hypothetical protein
MNKHSKIERLTKELLTEVSNAFSEELESKDLFSKEEVYGLVGAGGCLASVAEHVESFMNSIKELENYVNELKETK